MHSRLLTVSTLLCLVVAFVGTCYVSIRSWLMRSTSKLARGAHSSLVVSAVCQPPPDDVDACLQTVQWGVVKSRFGGTTVEC